MQLVVTSAVHTRNINGRLYSSISSFRSMKPTGEAWPAIFTNNRYKHVGLQKLRSDRADSSNLID